MVIASTVDERPKWVATARCGPCHWHDRSVGGRGTAEVLGEFWFWSSADELEWAMLNRNTYQYEIPGLIVPPDGMRPQRCRRGRHSFKRMSKAELIEAIENMPATVSAFYWPAS